MNLQLTLYEVFGYLFPGLIGMTSIGIGIWASIWPDRTLNFNYRFDLQEAIILVVVSYIMGHCIQAVANFIFEPILNKRRTLSMSDELLEKLDDVLKDKFSLNLDRISEKEKYKLCDETLIRHNLIGQREIYVYRKDFYRGLIISFAILTVTIIVCLFITIFKTTLNFKYNQTIISISPSLSIILLLLCILLTKLFYERFRRFSNYKLESSILGFLVWSSTLKNSQVNEVKMENCN